MKNFSYLLFLIPTLLLYNCDKEKSEPKPKADFNTDKTTIEIGETINFYDKSVNNPTAWSWDFGDGSTKSTSQNPSHTYSETGIYTVSLKITNTNGGDNLIKTNYITVTNPKPKAAFSSDKTVIEIGESISFYDESENNPIAWTWDFGDGSTKSASQNPSHTYSEAGIYSVSLKITNTNGDADNLTKPNYITVNERTTDVVFVNPAHTEIDITVQETSKTIPVGGSVTFENLTGTSTTIYASTSGKTADGTQIGLKMEWNITIDLSGDIDSHTLNVGPEYFFLYLTNNGKHILTPLWVNYLNPDYETIDEIEIPNDNVKHATGYYYAKDDTRIFLNFKDDDQKIVSWLCGDDFIFLYENNQTAAFSSLLKSNFSTSEPAASMLNNAGENLKLKSVQNKKTNHLFCKSVEK